MAQMLSAVNLHWLKAVLVASELALQTGLVSAEHELNVIARLKEHMPARLEIIVVNVLPYLSGCQCFLLSLFGA